MRVSGVGFGSLSTLLLVFCVAASPASDDTQATSDGKEPADLVVAYFRTEESKARRRLAEEIDDAYGGSIDRVAQGVRDAQLWPPLPERVGSLSFVGRTTDNIEISYQLPLGYDASTPWPVIIMAGEGDVTFSFGQVSEQLGGLADGFILLHPRPWIGGSFEQSPGAAADFRRFIRYVRQTFHTDTDRLYLYGRGVGGDAAWMSGIMHPDLFAGIVVFDSYPKVPFAEQLYPIILPNLASLPVLSIWSDPPPGIFAGRANAVAVHNRAIVEFAGSASLPIEGMALSGKVSKSATAEAQRKLLSRRRRPDRVAVSHWFRYPMQGHAAWFRQSKFLGEVWTADQLAILPGPSVDRDVFMGDIIRDHLAYVGGHRDGDSFRLETRKCAGVTLSLPLGEVDPGRSVSVYCNGKRRHTGAITPSARTLLAHAYRTWDLQHLVVAEISFSIRQDRP
ncbi:MAG: hypothetical protein IIC51_04505 [Planctomycetes bacterium]|nr:hypothetical protein [Planctomycetota bacterium]